MALNEWCKSKMATFGLWEMALVKIGVASATLMIAKLWADILYLDWYWYLVIWFLAALIPWYKLFKK